MSYYTTVGVLKQVVPMINSVTSIQSADIALFINHAEAVVNSRIAKKYTVPVVPAPPILETISTDLSLYRLLVMRFFTQEQMNKSVWPDRFKEANDLLDKIADGSMPLITSSGGIVEASASEGSMFSSTEDYAHTFDEDDELQQSVSDIKIDDIRATR